MARQPAARPGYTTPRRYMNREEPDHAQTGRRQSVVYRAGAVPFVIP